jgi:hypothetical protein
MFKKTLATTALVALTACMGSLDSPEVTRGYTGSTVCGGMNGISATYINNNGGFASRCGPQSQSPYSYR